MEQILILPTWMLYGATLIFGAMTLYLVAKVVRPQPSFNPEVRKLQVSALIVNAVAAAFAGTLALKAETPTIPPPELVITPIELDGDGNPIVIVHVRQLKSLGASKPIILAKHHTDPSRVRLTYYNDKGEILGNAVDFPMAINLTKDGSIVFRGKAAPPTGAEDVDVTAFLWIDTVDPDDTNNERILAAKRTRRFRVPTIGLTIAGYRSIPAGTGIPAMTQVDLKIYPAVLALANLSGFASLSAAKNTHGDLDAGKAPEQAANISEYSIANYSTHTIGMVTKGALEDAEWIMGTVRVIYTPTAAAAIDAGFAKDTKSYNPD